MRTKTILACVLVMALGVPALAGNEKEQERLQESGVVLKEILDIPDAIPPELLDRAECVVVIPSTKKLAIGIGGSYGRGAMSCRTGENHTGSWSAPALYALEGANIGIQLGGQATDLVLLVMNNRGVESLLKSKTKLGADASAAAGPKGRTATAATDAFMRAEILAYSRSRGLFAGISLEGSTLRQDGRANRKLYGREIKAREIIRNSGGGAMVATLNAKSPRNLSDPKSLRSAKGGK